MFLIGMAEPWCVYGGIEWTDEEEDDEYSGSYGKGCSNGDYHRVLCDLVGVSQMVFKNSV